MQAEKWRHADSCGVYPLRPYPPLQSVLRPSGPCTCGLSDLLAALEAGPVVIDREGIKGVLVEEHPRHPLFGGLYGIIPPDDHEEANDGG